MIEKFLVTAKVNWSWIMKEEANMLLVDNKIIMLLNDETFFVSPMS